MSSNKVPSAFAALGFARLSAVSYIYTPAATTTTLSTRTARVNKSHVPAPDLIIFPSWLDALPKHTAKFIAEYQIHYPTSPIIIITHSIWEDLKGTRANRLRWYGPTADYIQSLPSTANVLLHSVSNGGCLSILNVAKIYRERTGSPLPIRAQVLDSSPGAPSFWSDIEAVTTGISSTPVRLLARALVTVYSFIATVIFFVLRKKHPVLGLRDKMADPTLFNVKAPRVYIYSKTDKMVSGKAVEEHIVQARKQGFEAWGEEWVGSKHVAHMMMDRERYWGVVQEVWRRGFEEVDNKTAQLNGVAGKKDDLSDSYIHA